MPARTKRRLQCCLPAALLLGTPLGALGQSTMSWQGFADADAAIRFDSNLGNGQAAQDIHSDLGATAGLSGGELLVVDDATTLSVRVGGAAAVFDRYSGMDNLALNGTTALKHKFGLGARAPWVALSMSASRLVFRNAVRTGWLYQPAVSAGLRPGERWEARVDYRIDYRSADHERPSDPDRPADVFHQRNANWIFGVHYALTEHATVSAGYTRRTGDAAVSTSAENPAIDRISSAETADTVFGVNTVAYKLHANSNVFFVGFSQDLGSRSLIGLEGERQMIYAAEGVSYYKSVITAFWTYSF